MRKLMIIPQLLAASVVLVPLAHSSPAYGATRPVSCPSGYHFSRPDGACIATRTPTCVPPATWDSRRKSCVQTRRPVCPPNYRLSGGACVPTSSAGPPPRPGTPHQTEPPSCPPGFTWQVPGRTCISTARVPGNCPSGYDYSSSRGICLSTRPANCPSGYRLDVARGNCTTGAVAQ